MWHTIREIKTFVVGMHPVRLTVLGYLSYIIVGWVLLCLPFSVISEKATSLDNLFTATSALSTTGLATVSVSDDYSFFGQVVILILIQLGGIGYMTFGSFIVLSRQPALSKVREDIGKVVFNLPESFHVGHFIRSVIIFTALIETIGAIALYFIFRDRGQPDAIWSAVFHSVSSFCTAGFSLYNSSMTAYSGDFWVIAVIAALSYLGAIGFIVFVDVWRMATRQVEHITLTTKIILHATLWMTVIGTLVLFIQEPSIRALAPDQRLLAAFFQAMTAMTTVGFNTIDISVVSRASLLLMVVLMVIGASPSGTGGGLKSTTFSAIMGVLRSGIHGEMAVSFWGRPIPQQRVRLAIASFCFYVCTLLLGIYALTLTQSGDFEGLVFEAASALGTVGLSTGITASLTSLSKIVIVLLMFVGRIGPLVFGISLFVRCRPDDRCGDNDLVV